MNIRKKWPGKVRPPGHDMQTIVLEERREVFFWSCCFSEIGVFFFLKALGQGDNLSMLKWAGIGSLSSTEETVAQVRSAHLRLRQDPEAFG